MLDAADRTVLFESETKPEKQRSSDWEGRRIAAISPFHRHVRLLRTRQAHYHADLMPLLSRGEAALYNSFLEDWRIPGIAATKLAQSVGAYWVLSLLDMPTPPGPALRSDIELLGRLLAIRLGSDRRAEQLLRLPGYSKMTQRRFNLTAAEMNALDALLSANDEQAAAVIAGIQVSTLRSHRKSLYAKLDVTSKDELRRRIEALGPS